MLLLILPAAQQQPEQQQAVQEASFRWLSSQPLLAATLTSSSQEQAIEAALNKAAAAAAGADPTAAGAADNGDSMELDVALKSEEGEAAADEDAAAGSGESDSSGQQGAFGPTLMQLKRDLLRIEALLADTLKVGRNECCYAEKAACTEIVQAAQTCGFFTICGTTCVRLGAVCVSLSALQ
jgi:hypothetical protein